METRLRKEQRESARLIAWWLLLSSAGRWSLKSIISWFYDVGFSRSINNQVNNLADPIQRQERPQTVGLGETERAENVNDADVGIADLVLRCPSLIMRAILRTNKIL